MLHYYCLVSAQSFSTEKFIRDKSHNRAIQAAKHYIDSLQINQHIPGISVCVGNKEKILWAEGRGFADLENKVLFTINSMFRRGSVSKVLTSLAVGWLYQQGQLNLDAPIQLYLPNFPTKQYSFTARQLAGHTDFLPQM